MKFGIGLTRTLVAALFIAVFGVQTERSAYATMSQPTNLAATANSTNKGQISWAPPSGATSSVVIFRKDGVERQVRTTSSSLLVSLESGSWQVAVKGRTATELGPETSTSLTINSVTPVPPTNLTAQAINGRVILRWSLPAGITVSHLTWLDISNDQATPNTLTIAGPGYASIGSLVNGHNYSFSVSSMNGAQESAAVTVAATPVTAPVAVAPVPAAAPMGVTSSQLSWPPVPNAAFYAVYVGPTNNPASLRQGRPRITTSTSLVVNGLPAANQTAYLPGAIGLLMVGLLFASPQRLRVWAILVVMVCSFTGAPLYAADPMYAMVVAGNLNGFGPTSSTSSLPVLTAPTEAPTLSLTTGTGSISASWTAVSGANSYTLYLSSGTSVNVATATVISNASSPMVINSLTNGQTYSLAVSASNDAGEGPLSASQTVTLPSPPVAAPTVSVTAGDGAVTITWPALSDATGYKVYYMAGSFSVGSATMVSPVTSPYAISGLTNGTQYSVAVSGVNDAGEGPLSSVLNSTPTAGVAGFQGISSTLNIGTYLEPGITLADGRIMVPSADDTSRSLFVDPISETASPAPLRPSVGYPFYSSKASVQDYGFTYHRMPDGRIFLFSDLAYNPVYVWTPSTNAWTQAGDIPTFNVSTYYSVTHGGYSSVVLDDGRILIVGGERDNNGVSPIIATFNTTTYAWDFVTYILGDPDGRAWTSAIKLQNGKVLITGGHSYGEGGCNDLDNCTLPSPSAQIFDPATNTVTATGGMITPRYAHSLSLLPDGRVLALGGMYRTGEVVSYDDYYNGAYDTSWIVMASGNGLFRFAETFSAEIFDPATGTWTATGSLPGGPWTGMFQGGNYFRRQLSIPANPNGSVTVMAAKGPAIAAYNNTPSYSAFYTWTPASGSWTEAPGGPTYYPERCDYSGSCANYNDSGAYTAYLPDGRIFVTGGDSFPRLYH